MIPSFRTLNQEEIDLMYKVPVLITVLIAGADNDIDKNEIEEAISLAKFKKNRAREILLPYYRNVSVNFEEQLTMALNEYPHSFEERNRIIEVELKKLNSILPKLEKEFAVQFYASIKDFAKHIAEASGGILGYMAVSYEEAQFLDLKMINDPGMVV
jgi:hypothetical protein